MLLPGGTLRVSQTLPPMTEPRPMVTPPEDGGAGVDDDVILDDRMPRQALHERAALVDREAFRAERHAPGRCARARR